jgi:hypothetical protein
MLDSQPVFETGFEQIGEREIDRGVRPWRVRDTYRAWLRYQGRTYHETIFFERDWAGPDDAPYAGESAPAGGYDDLYGQVRSAMRNLYDRATTFGIPGEPTPAFDGPETPPYAPSPDPPVGPEDREGDHIEGACWCGETHQAGICPGCGKPLDNGEWHYHGH